MHDRIPTLKINKVMTQKRNEAAIRASDTESIREIDQILNI